MHNHSSTSGPQPGLWNLLTTFFVLGIQSFGGGSSTFFLIHQVCMARGWLDEETFLRNWALAQISPGINLLKLTVLLGQQLRGWPGILAATTGLLLPSALVTALMTAGFSVIHSQPLVQAALKGVLPAAIGLSLAMGVQMGQPLLTKAYHEGSLRLGLQVLTLIGTALLFVLSSISPVIILLVAGAVTVALMAIVPVKKPTTNPELS